MKRSIMALMSLSLCIFAAWSTMPASSYSLAAEGTSVLGDVNGDRQVTVNDVTAVYDVILGTSTTYAATADVNGDGQVTVNDVTAVYDVILNGSGSSESTVIKMNDYYNALFGTPAQRVWADDVDVIYITLDDVEANMYVLVRQSGKWTLRDISGSSKAGFATSGTLRAAWVRNGAWSTDAVYSISIPYDYALGSGTYTRSGSTVAINLNLELQESMVQLSGSSVNTSYSMTNCSHTTAIANINSMMTGGPDSHDGTSISPVKALGYSYVAFGNHTDVNAAGNTVFHCTKPDGRSWRRTGSGTLTAGQKLTVSDPVSAPSYWTRDFVMSYYDRDNTQKRLTLSPSTTVKDTIHMTVGTQIDFMPMEGGQAVYNGTTHSYSSTNSSSVSAFAYSTANSVSIKAMKVGEADVAFYYTNPLGDSFNFKAHVVVSPTVWLAGSYNGKPALYRNRDQVLYSLSVDGTAISKVFVRKGYGYINVGSYVMRSSNPHYGGSYITRYNTNIDNLFVTTAGDVWHTYGNNVYKNNSYVRSVAGTITDLTQDEESGTGYVWLSGYTSASTSQSSSSDVAWLMANLAGTPATYNFASDNISTDIGGYQPDGRYHTGPRSPHFEKIAIQSNIILINGYDIEEHAYRDYNGNVHESYYTLRHVYTYEGSSFARQEMNGLSSQDINFILDMSPGSQYARVYYIANGKLYYDFLRGGPSWVLANSSLPDLQVMKYHNGSVYAYGEGKVMLLTPSQGGNMVVDKEFTLNSTPAYINDIFIETDCTQ